MIGGIGARSKDELEDVARPACPTAQAIALHLVLELADWRRIYAKFEGQAE